MTALLKMLFLAITVLSILVAWLDIGSTRLHSAFDGRGYHRLAGLVSPILAWGPIYKISYDLSYDYRKFIVRPTYDSDLKRAEISLRDIAS